MSCSKCRHMTRGISEYPCNKCRDFSMMSRHDDEPEGEAKKQMTRADKFVVGFLIVAFLYFAIRVHFGV